MGYVAVSGGEQAIAASLELLERERVAGGRALDPELIIEAMPHAVEQVQSVKVPFGLPRLLQSRSSRHRVLSRKPSSWCVPTAPRSSASTHRA